MHERAKVSWGARLDEAVDRQYDSLVAVRRHLHAHPEPSGHEQETTKFLAEQAAAAGLQVQLGPEARGLMADLENPRCDQRVALRADIDALLIGDAKQVEYRSQVPGVMHACGHDGHAAIVLGACRALAEQCREGSLPAPVALRAIFQPAEETCQGAMEMLGAGAVEGVGAIFGLHVDPTRPLGEIGIRSGVLTANCDELIVMIRGRGGHAARPHLTVDPIAAAVKLVSAIYQNMPRAQDSQDATVVSITEIHGGDTANSIPDCVRLRGTVRTLCREVRQASMDHLRRLAAGVQQITGADIDVQFGAGSPSVLNDPQLTDMLARAAALVVGQDGVAAIPRPSMGSEDFAFYLEHVPGAMMRLGCASPRCGQAGLHSPSFDLDEESLRIGAKVLARAAVLWQLEASPEAIGKHGCET